MQFAIKWLKNLDELDVNDIGSWPPFIKILLLLLLNLFVLGIGYKLDSVRQIAFLQEARSEEHALRQSYETQRNLASSFKIRKNQMGDVTKTFYELQTYFAQKNDIPILIEELMQDKSLIFRQVKLLPENEMNFYMVQPIEFSVLGSYVALMNFIEKMANYSKIITLHDFVIRSKINENSLPCLMMSMNVKIYYLKERVIK